MFVIIKFSTIDILSPPKEANQNSNPKHKINTDFLCVPDQQDAFCPIKISGVCA